MPTQVQSENGGSLLTPALSQGAQPTEVDALQAIAAEVSLEDQILERFLDRLALREDVSASGLNALRDLVESGFGIRKDSVLRAMTDAETWTNEVAEHVSAPDEIGATGGGIVSAGHE